MPGKKIIVVFGATGAQGGGLVRAILSDPESEFSVRAVTRDVHSEKAIELANSGAEVVSADIDDLESVKSALKGAFGAYFVTFFWAHFSPERELEEAENMARAAKDQGLHHVIWSTLENTRDYIPLEDNRMPTLMGKYKVPHFDAKGEANKFFYDYGVPTTYLLTSFYWDNLVYFGMGPKKNEEGKLVLTFPMGDKKLSGIAAQDIGRAAYGIFKKGAELVGQTVGIAGEHLTGNEMAAALSKALGEEVSYQQISFDAYRSLGFPGADDLGNMFQFYHDFAEEFAAKRSVDFTRELDPALQSFDKFLAENAKKLPLD